MQIIYEILTHLLSLLPAFAPYLVSIITGIGGLMVGKRKRKADAAQAELANVQEAIRIWRETAQALEKKVDELMLEIESLRLQNSNLERKLNELSK